MSPLARRPHVVVLDVNETLTDMSPLAARLREVGAPGHLLATWFAGTLRDGIALTAAGAYAGFAEIAGAVLHSLLAGQKGLDREPAAAVEHVLAGLAQLPLQPDVAPGVMAVREAGYRVVALTNGSAETAAAVLDRGGISGALEEVLSVSEVQRWKPAPEPYRFAAERCRVSVEDMLLAAVHPWDVDGAMRAGLGAAWINRPGGPYPDPLLAPELEVGDFGELARALSALQ